MAVKRVNVGMRRAGIEKLVQALQSELEGTGGTDPVEVTLYGDTDNFGAVLTVSNDDMERDDVHADAIYVEVDE